jgi:hypothetical protein
LRRQLGGFIGSKVKRNQYRKAEPNDGTKSSRKKTQAGEEGRRVFSESFEENPKEEDPIPGYPFCIRSISPVAGEDRSDFLKRNFGDQTLEIWAVGPLGA